MLRRQPHRLRREVADLALAEDLAKAPSSGEWSRSTILSDVVWLGDRVVGLLARLSIERRSPPCKVKVRGRGENEGNVVKSLQTLFKSNKELAAVVGGTVARRRAGRTREDSTFLSSTVNPSIGLYETEVDLRLAETPSKRMRTSSVYSTLGSSRRGSLGGRWTRGKRTARMVMPRFGSEEKWLARKHRYPGSKVRAQCTPEKTCS